MKKILMILFVSTLIQGVSFAQENSLTLVPIKKGEEPKAVMDAIKRDFPKASTSDLSYLPSLIYNERWNVNENIEDNSDKYDLITVIIKENDKTYRAVYDQDGKILHTKTVIKDADLPKGIMKTIQSEYPGYSLVNDREKITSGKDLKSDIVYRVEIQKDNHGKITSLFFDNSGKILKKVDHLNL